MDNLSALFTLDITVGGILIGIAIGMVLATLIYRYVPIRKKGL
jgi:hypothetical protein